MMKPGYSLLVVAPPRGNNQGLVAPSIPTIPPPPLYPLTRNQPYTSILVNGSGGLMAQSTPPLSKRT